MQTSHCLPHTESLKKILASFYFACENRLIFGACLSNFQRCTSLIFLFNFHRADASDLVLQPFVEGVARDGAGGEAGAEQHRAVPRRPSPALLDGVGTLSDARSPRALAWPTRLELEEREVGAKPKHIFQNRTIHS